MVIRVLFLAALGISQANASMSVFGGSNFSSSTGSGYQDYSSSSSTSSDNSWATSLGIGMGVSQLVVSQGQTEEIKDSKAQMSLNLNLERMMVGPLGLESGLTVASQFFSTGGYQIRYLQIPALMRLHFGKYVSLGLGGFAAVPMNEETLPAVERLGSTDLGFMGSLRLHVPASRSMDWVLSFNLERGLAQPTSSAALPNHLRNFTAIAGIAARL